MISNKDVTKYFNNVFDKYNFFNKYINFIKTIFKEQKNDKIMELKNLKQNLTYDLVIFFQVN